MTTATVLIEGAMRSLGLLKTGFSTSSTELSTGLELLNQMLGSWSIDSLAVPYRTHETLTISTAASSYTIGTGATLNTARPIQIDNLVVKYGVTPYDVEQRDIKLLRAFINSISGIPAYFAYEPTYTTGTLYFDKSPTVPATLEMDSLKELTSFSTVTTDVDMPPGYDFAVRFNLAIYMAPEYGVQVPQEVSGAAMRGMDLLRSQNSSHRRIYSRVDSALTQPHGHYKVLSDQY